jgi:hypothetical protein
MFEEQTVAFERPGCSVHLELQRLLGAQPPALSRSQLHSAQ